MAFTSQSGGSVASLSVQRDETSPMNINLSEAPVKTNLFSRHHPYLSTYLREYLFYFTLDIALYSRYIRGVIKRRSQRRIPGSELKKNMIAVRLKDEEFVALEEISKREDLPISYFVREGIALVIEKYVKKR